MTTLATAHEERIVSTKGVKIFVRSWTPGSTPRAAARLGTAPAGTVASMVARGSR